MALYRDIVSCVFTDSDENEFAFDGVVAVDIQRGGKRLAASADDNQRPEIVDSTDHTSGATVYLKNFPQAVGATGAGAKAPARGTYGSLAVEVKSASGGGNITFTLGDGANTYARCMGGGAHPKHADVDAAASIRFRGFCPAGDTCPLAQS
jgi:hypothetical protein